MAHKLLTKSYWNSKSEIIEAANRGFNMQQMLPRMLQEAYPDLKSLKFGFCSEEDMPEWQSQGWRPIPPELFDVEEFNASSIPARFGLNESGGLIKWRHNYLMVMGKDFRAALMDARHQQHENYYEKSVGDRRYVAPEDPRRKDMLEVAESTLEEEHRNEPLKPDDPRGGVPQKRGPGRPRKQK